MGQLDKGRYPPTPVPCLEVRDRPLVPALAVSLFYDPRRTLNVTRICISTKQKPQDIALGLSVRPNADRLCLRVAAAATSKNT